MRAHIWIDSVFNNCVRIVFAKLSVRTVRHTAKKTAPIFDSLSHQRHNHRNQSHVLGTTSVVQKKLSQVAISIRSDLACRVEVTRQYAGNLAGYALVKMCLLMC